MLRSPEPNFKELQTYHIVKRVGIFPTLHAFPLQPETQTMGSRLLAWESFADHLLCPMRSNCFIPEIFIVNDYRGPVTQDLRGKQTWSHFEAILIRPECKSYANSRQPLEILY